MAIIMTMTMSTSMNTNIIMTMSTNTTTNIRTTIITPA